MEFGKTIFALSSAAGKAGVAVIRISGDQACAVFGSVIIQPISEPGRMLWGQFHDPNNQEIVDFGLYVYFKAPKSFTGEDCLELHVHGGLATVQAVLEILGELPNFRLAEPGEFTRRGFLNGKFDLTQAESTIDLIDAETTHQRRAALAQARGALHRLYEGWWQRLVELCAYAEACLDFSDEELPENLEQNLFAQCQKLTQEIQEHHATARQGERLRYGTSVAIVGPSNAGKSSLMNWLTSTETAIISPIAGTTRDSLVHHVDIAGYPVKLIDTAGLQETDDPIEREGIKRAYMHAESADLLLIVFDGSQPITAYEKFIPLTCNRSNIIVINKQDIGFNKNNNAVLRLFPHHTPILVSLSAPSGLDVLQRALASELEQLAGSNHAPLLMHTHYRNALGISLTALNKACCYIETASDMPNFVLVAEELRISLNSIAGIIGRVDVEDLLDVVFSRFCIGK